MKMEINMLDAGVVHLERNIFDDFRVILLLMFSVDGAKKFQKHVHQNRFSAKEIHIKKAAKRTNETNRSEHKHYEHEHYLHKITSKSQNMIQNINRL